MLVDSRDLAHVYAQIIVPFLQKQVGCFNHRVVTLVLYYIVAGETVVILVWKINCISNPSGSCPVHFTTTIH